jgi:hypothetical protein
MLTLPYGTSCLAMFSGNERLSRLVDGHIRSASFATAEAHANASQNFGGDRFLPGGGARKNSSILDPTLTALTMAAGNNTP